jgi:TRAP-type transport system periplasmic protein
MTKAIQIRMAGYGPATTGFSRALKMVGDQLTAQFGDLVDVRYVYNILDLGYRAEDILWMVEHGVLTLGYQSSSYLTDRVPELGFVDLPFLFENNEHARRAMDGELGRLLARKMEERINYKIVGYFENGFRHISNRLRTVEAPADLKDMRIRVLPSSIHAQTFELLGAVPYSCDLTEAIKAVTEGTIDAQENPLSNTVTYGVHRFHRFHSLTRHFYVSRPIFVHRASFESWPQELQEAMVLAFTDAIAWQRAVTADEETAARKSFSNTMARSPRRRRISTRRLCRPSRRCTRRRGKSSERRCSSC